MRIIRILLVLLLAAILIGIAFANGQMVTLRLLPLSITEYLGVNMAVSMPLFLVVILALAFGLALGLIWEYFRETRIRRAASRRRRQVDHLQTEVEALRERHSEQKDDVLAIIDGPGPTPRKTVVEPHPTTTAVAPR